MKTNLFTKAVSFAMQGILLTLLLTKQNSSMAQYVTIPDANFSAYLQANYPTCMDGDDLDTTCAEILEEIYLSPYDENIADITGVQYFKRLIALDVSDNDLTSLPPLPGTLQELVIRENQFVTLDLGGLPGQLRYLDASYNQLESVVGLPDSLESINLSNNMLEELSELPAATLTLDLMFNYLTTLPEIPAGVATIYAAYNPLTTLPELPDSLLYLIDMEGCNLYSLPELPSTLRELYLDFNYNLTCLPLLPERLEVIGRYGVPGQMLIIGTGITCIPNIPSSLFEESAHPICLEDDPIDNPGECTVMHGIWGVAYTDIDGEAPWYVECEYNSSEFMFPNVRFHLVDDMGDTVDMQQTVNEGRYFFTGIPDGEYTVKLDTAGTIYTYNCEYPGKDTTVEVIDSAAVGSVNFNIKCKDNYFDVGTEKVYASNGFVAGGEVHWLRVWTGEMPNEHHLSCTQALSGEIEIIVEGPVTSINPMPWCLTPTSVSGDTMRYTIADFSLVNYTSEFIYEVEVDPLADEEDEICVKVNVEPVANDANPANNVFEDCYSISGAYLRSAMDVEQTEEVNIEAKQDVSITAYPNPSNGTFKFYLPEKLMTDSGVQVTVYNLAGEKVRGLLLINSGVVTIDLEDEMSGVYFMTVQSGEEVITCKLLKQ